MKKAILPLVILTSLLASCGQENSQQQAKSVTQDDIATGIQPSGDGWQNLGNGVFKKVTPDGGIHYFADYKAPEWVNQLEGTSTSGDNLSQQSVLSTLETKKTKLNEIIKTNGNNSLTEMWSFIYDMRKSNAEKLSQQSTLSTQAVSCTPHADASPTSSSSNPGTKSNAYISCTAATNIGAEAHASANGQRQDVVNVYESNSYAQASAMKYGTNDCFSSAKTGGGSTQSKQVSSSGCY